MGPLLSIIIANYNYGRFLEEAIQSVLSQVGERRDQVLPGEVELIIIDGGSTDNSVEVIRKYAGELPSGVQRGDPSIVDLHLPPTPITYWVSEKDKGQSDAFNKGFARARGRFLTWLNADDVMLPGTIEKLKIAAGRHPKCEWFVGGCFWLDPEMRIVNCGRGRPFSEIRAKTGSVGVWGPSSFFTKRLLDSVGGVDIRFHYAMDNDLWHRFAYLQNVRYLPFCKYAWGLRLHPDAKMSGQNFMESEASDPNHPRWKQIKQEISWQEEYHKPEWKMNKLLYLLSVSWVSVLAARLDLSRYRGKHYMEFFK